MRNARKLGALICFGSALAFVDCSSNDSAPLDGGNAGTAGSHAGSGGQAAGGSAGMTAHGGAAGANGGAAGASGGAAGASGGAAGASAGSGGDSSGAGGASAGSGGDSSGAGGSGGSGGATGGTAGASAGTGGGSSGSGGANAGSGGNSAGSGGASAGSGGASGGSGGASAGSGGDTGGTGGASAGTGGDSGGSGGSGGVCPTPPFTEFFEFDDGFAINANPDGTQDAATNPNFNQNIWTRSRYGSTANGIPNQPDSPTNLAKKTTLTFLSTDGNPAPGSMQVSSAFSGTTDERLGLVDNFATYGTTAFLADVRGRQLTARVKLVSTPRTTCTFTATAWSTSDASSTMGTSFDLVNGTPATLTVGTWVTASIDLDTSANTVRVNQVGIDIKSSGCFGTQTGTAPTILEVDHVTIGCK